MFNILSIFVNNYGFKLNKTESALMEIKQEDIYSKVLRAGRRTYFFDVRETKARTITLTITESKKFTNDDGTFLYKKHKIYLYKEDFQEFQTILGEMIGLCH